MNTENAVKGRSLWQLAITRLLKNRAAMASIFILAIIVLFALFGPFLSPYEVDQVDWDNMQAAPSFANGHYFGTDINGRDIFVRIMYGTRISLLVGVVATAVCVVIGVTYGALAGYVGGRLDNIMMRFVDILYALPFMFFVILLMVLFGRDIILMFAAIGAIEWLTMSRIVRGETMSIKNKEFAVAALAMGVSSKNILKRHIIPNTLGTVIIYITLTIPGVILTESFLSFLGLGVQEPMTSLGVLISEGAASMESSWWMLVFPGTTLAVLLYCLNYIGDGLRDALDPKDS